MQKEIYNEPYLVESMVTIGDWVFNRGVEKMIDQEIKIGLEQLVSEEFPPKNIRLITPIFFFRKQAFPLLLCGLTFRLPRRKQI